MSLLCSGNLPRSVRTEHGLKVTVRCAVTKEPAVAAVSAFLLRGNAVTDNSARYTDVLNVLTRHPSRAKESDPSTLWTFES